MTLTTRQICELYARVRNLEQSPDAFFDLLHPWAQWVTKWWTGGSAPGIEASLREILDREQSGLSHIELVSGFSHEEGRHVDCTVAIPIADPDKHDTRTMFQTDGARITRISTYAVWMDTAWPHPHRVKNKLAELMVRDIPIAQVGVAH